MLIDLSSLGVGNQGLTVVFPSEDGKGSKGKKKEKGQTLIE